MNIGGSGGGGGGCGGMNVNLQALQTFHQRCGHRITLSNGNRTASRSVRDFSQALVFSAEPLIDDVLFEVVIERKVGIGKSFLNFHCLSPFVTNVFFVCLF